MRNWSRWAETDPQAKALLAAAFGAPEIASASTPSLTQAATGRKVWSETYDSEVKDISMCSGTLPGA